MPENKKMAPVGGKDGPLSEADAQLIRERLLKLLQRRTGLYTLDESSSVRVETAQALLKSIQFLLELCFRERGGSIRLLAKEDPEALLAQGLQLCEEKLEAGKALYAEACLTASSLENRSYKDTLTGIGGFFKRYDYRFFAHEIPCDMDYQLCFPVDERALGVAYINEYLRRLIIENRFLGCFEISRVERVLERACPDYRGLLINLYEPICTNAVGLALLEEDILLLSVSPDQCARVAALFHQLSATPAKKALSGAAGSVCARLGITNAPAQAYIEKTATDLYPRIEAALPHGNLGNIFLSAN